MWAFLQRLLDSSMFSPHGICLLWEPELIWLHVTSDALIALSYFSIPFALALLVSRRRDFQFGWIAWSFAAFILACGLTHVLSIYTLWVPIYGIEGLVKAMTAVASVVTAATMWPLLPKILAMPTAAQLRQAYVDLENEEKQRRRAELLVQRFRDIEATEIQIRQAQKMEALGQLTGGIAHDFNNILTVITGTIEILGEAIAHSPQLAAITRLIDEAASRGAAMTRHLLAFARKQPLQPTEIEVNALVVRTVALLRQTLGASIEIRNFPHEHELFALIDEDQLSTALLNLALNARDAMPTGGVLTLETSQFTLDRDCTDLHGGLAAGDYIVIALGDTGTGIPEDILDKVFDPFFTTKGVGKGTGLGLSMVYGFLKQSNGHVAISSRIGCGTTVRIYLPQAKTATTARRGGEPSRLAPRGHETILVVEDDPLVRSYVLIQIRNLGYDTLSAENAPEALALLSQDRRIDLLFTDIIMPGPMNGQQLSVEAAKLRPGLKVLFTSGYTEDAIIHHGRLDPGVLLLAKPYRVSDLAKMIRTALAALPQQLAV
jgi:signal transduction histidine kinase